VDRSLNTERISAVESMSEYISYSIGLAADLTDCEDATPQSGGGDCA
jgi:hypothetical protein